MPEPTDRVVVRPSAKAPLYVVAVAGGLFAGFLAVQSFLDEQTASPLVFAIIALLAVAAPISYFRNFNLFIDGDRFGKTDILGFEHSFPIEEFAHADWSGGRASYMYFISKKGHRLFTVTTGPWSSQELIAFVRRLDARKPGAEV